MHGYGGLPAARHALHDQIGEGSFPDDSVLFLLNRGDDLPQHRVFVAGKILYEQLIVGGHIAVIKTVQLSPVDIIGPFQMQIDGNWLFIGQAVTAFPQLVFVIDAEMGALQSAMSTSVRFRNTPFLPM